MPDETGDSDVYLTDVSPSDKPWDAHRRQAQRVEQLYRQTDYPQYGLRIHDCSNLLGFVLQAQDDGELRHRLKTAKFCRVRHCPVCQWRRQMAWRARFFDAVPRISEDYPKARWIFLTLTVRNVAIADLRSEISRMNKAWTRLSQRKKFKALGWVKSVEVTRRPGDEVHPHFHALLLVPPSYFKTYYVSQATWRELWKDCLRVDYLPVVNVRTVKAKPGMNHDQVKESLLAALLETLKYTVKPQDLVGDGAASTEASDIEFLQQLTNQLHNTRSISIGGCLRQYLSDSEPEDSELINPDSEEPIESSELELWYGWREMVQRYASVNR